MAIAELSDDATHEDIEKFVDQAVKEVEEDRKGEEGKTDPQQIAAEHNEPIEPTVTETKPDDEDTADEGEETGDSEDQAQDWLDDDLKAETAAYGIDEKELADFTSREELERAMRFADRSDLEAGRKVRVGRKEPEPEPKKEEPKEGQYEITLDKDAYDEGLVDELTRMRDHYDARIDVLESRSAESDAMVKQHEFDAAVDAMKHSDLFGTTGKESSKELERRQVVLDECEDIIAGRRMHNRQDVSYKSLVSRVTRMVFAEELGKKELKARTRKLSKQADGRLGGGTTKPEGPGEDLETWADRRYKELEGA